MPQARHFSGHLGDSAAPHPGLDSKDKDGKWGLGYDAVFNPYNDDVSFMAGELCCPVDALPHGRCI